MGASRRISTFLKNTRWLFGTRGLRASQHELQTSLDGLRVTLDSLRAGLEGVERRLTRVEARADEIRRTQASHAWVYGHRMRLDPNDTVVSRHLEQFGCFEPLETAVVRQAVRPGDIVLDIGANIGYYTLQFSDLVGPNGHVYAFEPDPRNYEILQQNIAQNGCRNVTMVQAAAYASTGSMRLFLNAENHGDHRVWHSGPARESLEVPMVAIDDYLAGRNVHAVDFVKIDVQGAEAAVMQGMLGVLASSPRLRLVTEFWPRGLHLAGGSPEAFLQALLADFRVYVIDESSGMLKPLDVPALLARLPREADTDIFFTNLYCERPDAIGSVAS